MLKEFEAMVHKDFSRPGLDPTYDISGKDINKRILTNSRRNAEIRSAAEAFEALLRNNNIQVT